LASCPENAAKVRIVEVRVWPFNLQAEKLETLEVQVVRALQNAHGLEELCWTRTGSLSDRVIMELFPHLKALKKLEITGDSRSWDPALLISSLRRPPRHLRCCATEDPPRSGTYVLEKMDDGDEGGSAEEDHRSNGQEREARAIERLSLLLPDHKLAYALPALCKRLGGQLKGISILSNVRLPR